MKKFKLLVAILICLLLLIACKSRELDKTKIYDQLIEYDDTLLEPDVNFIDIEKDIKMTEKIQKRKNLDYLLNIPPSSDGHNINFKLINLATTKTFNQDENYRFKVDLVYKKYLMPKEYLLITKEKVKIYENPSFQSNVVEQADYFEKIKILNEVKGDKIEDINSDKWFNLVWTDDSGNNHSGYVPESDGTLRRFRFDHMYNSILSLEEILKNNKFAYISNYKDINGSPPLMDNKGFDKYGMQAFQSAPAYPDLNDMSNFRYFPDGMIVLIMENGDKHYKVKGLDYEGEYWIPKKYVSFDNNIDSLDKIVVVDVINQNQGVFEKRNGNWTMISYGLATTGAKGKGTFETPIGKFKVQEKKERFYYLGDKTRNIVGYAPYGVRFAQGAYIHGVPVEYTRKDGNVIDPGIKEYLFTIGTMPRSHKCVRNYTSSAKFIYNWADPNSTVVIVIQ